ncbi:hypothetical protein CRUP_018024 [Coryphaenoides rupestris]|nr:hypothetical protein CRUP_018024 [Coryphaenoides rupestris]
MDTAGDGSTQPETTNDDDDDEEEGEGEEEGGGSCYYKCRRSNGNAEPWAVLPAHCCCDSNHRVTDELISRRRTGDRRHQHGGAAGCTGDPPVVGVRQRGACPWGVHAHIQRVCTTGEGADVGTTTMLDLATGAGMPPACTYSRTAGSDATCCGGQEPCSHPGVMVMATCLDDGHPDSCAATTTAAADTSEDERADAGYAGCAQDGDALDCRVESPPLPSQLDSQEDDSRTSQADVKTSTPSSISNTPTGPSGAAVAPSTASPQQYMNDEEEDDAETEAEWSEATPGLLGLSYHGSQAPGSLHCSASCDSAPVSPGSRPDADETDPDDTFADEFEQGEQPGFGVSLGPRNTYASSRRQSAPGELAQSEEARVGEADAADATDPTLQSRRPGLAEYFGRGFFSRKQRASSQSAPGWKLFGKVPPKESPTKNARTIQQESHPGAVTSVSTPDLLTSGHALGRSRKNLEFEPLSTTALILEDRPANLPAKSLEEAQRHRQQYNEMVAEAKKRELKEAQRRQRQSCMRSFCPERWRSGARSTRALVRATRTDGPYHNLLHSILGAYTCYRPDIGYMLKYFGAFEVFFEENLPRLFNHFLSSNLTPDLYLIDWIFSLYTKPFPLDVACRVWDVFCRDGEEFLFRVGLGILRLYQDVLLQMDFIHIAQFLARLPDEELLSDRLFSCIAATPMLSGNRKWNQVFSSLMKDPKETEKSGCTAQRS